MNAVFVYRDDPSYDEALSGCHLVSSCSNIYDKDQFQRLLEHNFQRHYSTNKAPLSLSFDAAWLQVTFSDYENKTKQKCFVVFSQYLFSYFLPEQWDLTQQGHFLYPASQLLTFT